MSNRNDFEINEAGSLERYLGQPGEIVIPEEVKAIDGAPVFCDIWDPIDVTLSPNMKCSAAELLSQGLTVLHIPAGTEFVCSAFAPNHSSFYAMLKEIHVDPANLSCASDNGILYNKEMTELYSCPAAHEGPVVIPKTVRKIMPHAFDGCKKLTEIVIPASVSSIGERAFMDCTGLKKIVLQGKKTKIGAEAFLRCSKITTAGLIGTGKGKGFGVEFPWTETIPENAFSGMTKLKSVALPETVKSIGKNAFKGCKSLESINLPENVKCDKKTFKDCKNLSV